jgi:hypothetical protein
MSAASSTCHRRVLGILLGLGLGLSLSGCASSPVTTSPKDTLLSAVDTAKHGRARRAGKVLTGSALTVFGTKEGLAAFRDKLSKVVSMSEPRLITSRQGDQGYHQSGDVSRVYSTNVSGLTKAGAPARYTVQITCGVTYQEIHLPAQNGYAILDPMNPHSKEHTDPQDAFDWEGEVEDCRVSQILARAE